MANEIDQQVIDDYKKTIVELTKLRKDELKSSKKTFEERVKFVRKEFSDRRASIRDTYKESKVRKELIKLLEKEEDEFEKELGQREKQRKAIAGVTSALGGLYGAAEKGEGTISSFTSVFKGKGVFGSAFSALGDRLDTNIETFRQLSQTGANFGQSIVQMRVAAGQALLPLDDFASLIAQNAQNLAALYGSTTEGAKRIAELSEGMRTASVESLAPLGFTIDEINDTLLLNLERQRRTFNFDANARTQNIKSAINFAKQLDRLAKLTGTQREELQKQIEAQMSNERFQAMLAGATDETRQRLENFAATIGSISPELTEGFQDLIANAGRPVTDAAIALIQNMPEAQAAIQNLISGTTTSEQALMSVRNAAIKSQDRFRMATVTGTVEFLRLQGGVIKLGTTALDLNAVMSEQAAISPGLTKGLTEFQDATKRLSGQFQKIETGLLAGFGPLLGKLADWTTGGMQILGGIAEKVAKVPMLSASLLLGGIIGKYLFSRGEQILITTLGVRAGTSHLGAGGLMGQTKGLGGKVKGSFGGSMAGGFGNALSLGKGGIGSKLLRGGGLVGAGLGGIMAAGQLMDDDKSNNAQAWGTLAGTTLGAFGGPLGMMLGGMAGGAIGNMIGGKAHGGPMAGGNPKLVGEAGPEIVMTKANANVLSNADSKKMLSTENMEKILTTIASGQATANKIHTQHLETLNTGTMIQNKIRVASETTARKRYEIGNV
ncbi:hypothetical protein CMI38_05800 [Candidatus Pacearchaeota archaeon]|nr:hypothetical protein [Candidatus Pacearchaeota archaeon]